MPTTPEVALPTLLTANQTAELLKLRPQTLAKWRMTGRHLPVVRIGDRSVRYRLVDVLAYLQRNMIPAAD